MPNTDIPRLSSGASKTGFNGNSDDLVAPVVVYSPGQKFSLNSLEETLMWSHLYLLSVQPPRYGHMPFMNKLSDVANESTSNIDKAWDALLERLLPASLFPRNRMNISAELVKLNEQFNLCVPKDMPKMVVETIRALQKPARAA